MGPGAAFVAKGSDSAVDSGRPPGLLVWSRKERGSPVGAVSDRAAVHRALVELLRRSVFVYLSQREEMVSKRSGAKLGREALDVLARTRARAYQVVICSLRTWPRFDVQWGCLVLGMSGGPKFPAAQRDRE